MYILRGPDRRTGSDRIRMSRVWFPDLSLCPLPAPERTVCLSGLWIPGALNMGSVVAILRVLPESVEINLDDLKATLRKNVPSIQDIAEEPIAFGLKALKVAAVVGDDEGGTEPLEKAIAAIPGVASVETIDLNRMI